MQQMLSFRWSVACAALVTVLALPLHAEGQTISGQARVVQVIESGTTTTVLSDTGTLASSSDARETSQVAGSIASILEGGTLHAVTIGWPDEAASEASIGNLVLTVGSNTIRADLVMSRVRAVYGSDAAGTVGIDGLIVNGVPVTVTGDANQTVALTGGRIVINEQQVTSSGTVVNALHVTVTGEPDVVVASVSAGVR